MIRICTYCEIEGQPAVMGEKPPLDDPSRTDGICDTHRALLSDPARERAWFARWRTGEQVTVTWTRPDGQEAVQVVFLYPTPAEASMALTQLFDVVGRGRAPWFRGPKRLRTTGWVPSQTGHESGRVRPAPEDCP